MDFCIMILNIDDSCISICTIINVNLSKSISIWITGKRNRNIFNLNKPVLVICGVSVRTRPDFQRSYVVDIASVYSPWSSVDCNVSSSVVTNHSAFDVEGSLLRLVCCKVLDHDLIEGIRLRIVARDVVVESSKQIVVVHCDVFQMQV